MSSAHEPTASFVSPDPGPPPRRLQRPGFFSRVLRIFSGLAKAASVIFVVLAVLLAVVFFFGFMRPDQELREHFYLGTKDASSKIAVIRVEGVLMEGFIDYAKKQIDAAAQDDQVKAVVLRIVSPGGTITASDELRKLLGELRDGKNRRYPGKPKPIVVSMGSLTASGGYYIAMIKSEPATVILAEPSTVTGSIGVYASFPNVSGTLDKIGARMDIIKAGNLKASGSPFRSEKEMPAEEKQLWQHMVDHAYLQFLHVVEDARPHLTVAKLQDDVEIDETLDVRHGTNRKQHLRYTRYLADGGIFTADQALRFKLVDQLGYVEDAIRKAAELAKLKDQDYRAVVYDRPQSVLGALLGAQDQKPPLQLDAGTIASAAGPRLWYLAPQHELAGLLAVLSH